tara:strand:- start:1776 stop:2075 length:300 start_codon:yes stop_codon:yes gene_type:complete
MIIRSLNEKIESILIENKSGVKNYASPNNAEKAAINIIKDYPSTSEAGCVNIEFMIVYAKNREGAGRFVPVINFGKYMNSGMFKGGYIGHFASQGFMQI